MTMQIIKTLTEAQRLALTARLASLIDCREDRFLEDVYVPVALEKPLMDELEKEGFIVRRAGRVAPGAAVPKPDDVQTNEDRRTALLRSSPLGRKLLGENPGGSPDRSAGGMSAERRKQFLSGSELGRGVLRGEEAKTADAKKVGK